MIIVTGATGQLGRAVVDHVSTRAPKERIVATVRDASKAADLAAKGVEVRTADFADAGSLPTAFAGGDQVLLVSTDKIGDEALSLHRSAIEAARQSNVRRVLYTSHMGARIGSPFAPADQHARTEEDLAHSGLAYTSLRHGFYAESCYYLIGDGFRSGEIRTPEDGPVSWTARADLAEADAAILANEGDWDGITAPLTASNAITMAELATIASEVTGRDVRHITVTDDEWRNAKIAAGMPEIYADMMLGVFKAARRGDFAATDVALEMLLDRPPRTMREILGGW